MNYETLILAKGKEKALERKHPWIFSGAFKNIPSHLQGGEIIEVLDSKNNFKAIGFFSLGRIAVKVLSFSAVENIEDLLKESIENAVEYRSSLGFFDDKKTNCQRLIFGEADSLPGLIVDQYDHTAVIQLHHKAWLGFLNTIAENLLGKNGIRNVYHKLSEKISTSEIKSSYLIGEKEDVEIKENGHSFLVDWEDGQKTGFFIDQRENRRILGEFSNAKSILNCFSYTGGFSIYALKNGASKVVSVDISQSAIDMANANADLNRCSEKHEGFAQDVFEYLKENGDQFDIIILDPPAFSKNRRTLHNAVQAYKRLNLLAFKKIKKGGLVFSFSCSQHVNPKLFEDTIRAAALESNRKINIIQKLGQPSDHPMNIYYPEGEYLKGLILRID
tara:strand:- start:179 stop:1345 length:1167 start_codon:yes stop_codon:yes gene_type:complete